MAYSTINKAEGERIFAIGDIHGCPDEPAILLDFLENDQGLTDFDVVIFLGDYVDRGPNSKAAIDLLLEFKLRFPNTRFLKGNHEVMMLDFLGFGGSLGQAFMYNGGIETLQSYGISVFAPPDEMVSALPPQHFKFISTLESVIQVGDFTCVHAGLNPVNKFEEQLEDDVYWIRDEFIANVHNFDTTVVFGHTPYKEVFLHLPYKVGIDTGLVFGNKLSCIELVKGDVFQVSRGSKEVVVSSVATS